MPVLTRVKNQKCTIMPWRISYSYFAEGWYQNYYWWLFWRRCSNIVLWGPLYYILLNPLLHLYLLTCARDRHAFNSLLWMCTLNTLTWPWHQRFSFQWTIKIALNLLHWNAHIFFIKNLRTISLKLQLKAYGRYVTFGEKRTDIDRPNSKGPCRLGKKRKTMQTLGNVLSTLKTKIITLAVDCLL